MRNKRDSYYLAQSKSFWGFNIDEDGKISEEFGLSKYKPESVRKLLNYYYDENFELHVMPDELIPFVMLKNPNSTWYFATSEDEARGLVDNIMIDGLYKLCQVG